jgi:CHAT domain-containing protein
MRERRLLDARYEQARQDLSGLHPLREASRLEEALAEMRDLKRRKDELRGRLRQAAPRLAALQDPQPLDLAGVQAALDPGTLLLAYSVGRERSVLFAVTRSKLEVHWLAAGDETLREEVETLRRLLQRRQLTAAAREALGARAHRLYALLLQPAAPLLEASERVLVSPDGPLQVLPFGALVLETHPALRFLVEKHAVHVVTSATLYAELRRQREGPEPVLELAAFGDPVPPAPGYGLTALPEARREALALAELYPGRGQHWVGAEATEQRLRSVASRARRLHLACHARIDERFPLDSALVLSGPEAGGEQDDGLLHVWEIFEKLRLRADLVTLSACETGLGSEMGGEGLFGLVRAFQYAGARAVVASLWSVPDASTAELMVRFHGHLLAGRSTDEALRAGQLELLHGKTGHGEERPQRWADPFYWAGFELIGDWR